MQARGKRFVSVRFGSVRFGSVRICFVSPALRSVLRIASVSTVRSSPEARKRILKRRTRMRATNDARRNISEVMERVEMDVHARMTSDFFSVRIAGRTRRRDLLPRATRTHR